MAWLVVVLYLLSLFKPTYSQAIQITDIRFGDNATYSTTVLGSYSPLTIWFKVLYSNITAFGTYVRVELPHAADGNPLDMGFDRITSWTTFPGSDRSWKPAEIYYENIYTIRSAVDTTGWTVDSPLYAGYQGKLVISDVRMPSDCIDPGSYTLTIGTASTTYRPVSRHVLCPEIANMDVSLYPNTYDTSNVTLYFSIRVAYFNFTITNGYFDITFPYGSYPEVYVIGNNATTTFSAPSFRFVPTVNGYYNGEYLPNITTSREIGYYHQPRWRHRFLLDIVSWKSDSVLNFTFGPILTPWSCSNQLPICVQVGPIKGCATPSGVVQGCPVLKNLAVEFTPSNRYLTKEATATFRFTVADYPLYAKPKYQVRLDFPSYVGFILRYSYLATDATPLAQIYQSTQTYSDLRLLTQKNSFQIFDDTDPYVVFMLNGTSNYEPDYMTRYVPANTEVEIKLANVTLPANCDYHYYNLSIGPFTTSTVMTSEISGCVNISDLDLTFSPNNYQGSVVTAKFSFTVGTWPMATDYVKITYPYYTGSGKQFKVTSYAHDRRRFSMNGFANGGLTLYKGLTYVFEVNSRGAPFAIVNDVYSGNETWVSSYGTLYNSGVTNNNIEVGYLWFTVPFNAPSTLVYQCPTHPLMKGDLKILDRPRGIQLANSYFGTRSGSITGTLFDSNAQVVKKWQAYDTPTVSTNFVSGRPSTETFMQFYSRNENVDSVPVQYGAVMEVSNVQLPTDECDDLGSFTLTVGLWGTTSNPISDIIYCPYIRDLEVKYFSHVAGTQDNIAYITFTNYGAPLSSRDVTVLFPPLSGISLSNSAGFLSMNGDWTSTRAPVVVNYHGVQVSISLLSTTGTAIQPNVSRSTIAVYGVNLPSACGNLPSLGNYTLVIGPYRVEYDPPTDYLFCPNMTMLDVMFDPVANQSATTDAYLSFNISDYMDPGTISIYIPPTISFTYGSFVWVAKVGDEYAGWTLDSKTLKRDFAGSILQIKPTSGRRLSPGRHYIRITNITLPRGNCSDLGLWGVQIGPTSLFENPPSDVVEGCVVLKDLIVTFSPSHEQGGQGVNMTFTFTVTKSALWFIYGDSDWIDFTIPSSVGITVGSDSQFVNVLGNWQPIPTRKVVKSNGLSQTFSDGNMINVGQRVSFTVTNAHLPKNCLSPGDWVVNIGIWSLTASPVNNTGLVLCPKITNLEVMYSPSIACNDVGIIKVFFDVEDMQLRAGVLKFDFPPDSGVTLWPFATISDGPGDWVCGPKAPVVVPPVAKCPKCCDQTEISYTQTCTGSPLPVGRNYSFIMHNVGTPCKNCTDVGLYKLAVDQWTSVWTNPKLDVLACPGVISGINVTMSPTLMNRRSSNATYRFKFTVPNCQFNEIRIQFPEGYQPSRTYPTKITDSFGVTLYRTYVVVEGRVLILRNITCDPTLPRASSSLPPTTPADSQYIYLEVSNIGLPNNCDPGTWLITTRTCGYYDRSEGQYPPVFYCPKSFGDASGVVTSADAVPYFCTSCNACYVEFLDSNNNPVYECTNNDLTFQRTSLDSSTCSTTTTNSAPEF